MADAEAVQRPIPPDNLFDGEVAERDGYKLLAQGDGIRVQRSYAVLAANGAGLGAYAQLDQADQAGTAYAVAHRLTAELRAADEAATTDGGGGTV